MNLFTSEGWINYEPLFKNNYKEIYGFGARAIGKTYGFIAYAHQHHIPAIIIRRLTPQIEAIAADANGGFSEYCRKNNLFYRSYKKKGNRYDVYIEDSPDKLDKRNPPDRQADFCLLALSTLAGFRGTEFTQYTVALFDEYIAEERERPIKEEWRAFQHAYSTLNRLKGTDKDPRPALKVIFMGNALRMSNPYFIGAELIERVAKMVTRGEEVKYFPQTHRMVLNYFNSDIAKLQHNLSIYKGEYNAFTKMALLNQFKELGEYKARKIDFAQFKPYAQIGILRVDYSPVKGEYFIRCLRNESATAPVKFPDTEQGYKQANINLRRVFMWAFANDKIIYENLTTKCLAEDLLQLD